MASLTIGWLGGSLVSAGALHHALVESVLGDDDMAAARAVRQCRAVQQRAAARLGPASGALAVWHLLGEPVLEVLRWTVRTRQRHDVGRTSVQVARLDGRTGHTALLVCLPWGTLPGPLARPACRLALDAGVRWAMVTNGLVWRWHDARRPLGRQHVELHLRDAVADERVFEALWLMGSGDADRLDRLHGLSMALERSATRAVREAVADVRVRLTQHLRASEDEVLTHVFRWLFLLFAEARHLLPMHNPVYRQSYAVSTLATHARGGGRPPYNLWEGLHASATLAHTGSRHPLLPLTALNGALFEPDRTPRGRCRRLSDAVVAPMLDALTTVTRHGRRTPVAFADLGVEHLGTIYEDVLAGRAVGTSATTPDGPAPDGPALVRKQTGTFYTPRDLADELVADTLAPLVLGQSADAILSLRVVDPAAGSGAILASVARYLLSALEAAWLREGLGGPLDVPERVRADAIRRIVEQCLYGVDVHGRAVQVARLSLWLVSMRRERPLTFLDHHVRTGNSLIGTTPADIVSRRPGRSGAIGARHVQPALFDLEAWDREAAALATGYLALAATASDSAEAVREKAQRFRALHDEAGVRAWRRRADLWCGAWMHDTTLPDGLWADLDRLAQGRPTTAPPPMLENTAATLERHAREAHSFHWALEFPDIFHARERQGFDAVIANPPWEVLRADLGTPTDRADTRAQLARQQRFITRSGFYSGGTTGHRNLHQLFVERMLQLCRHGGRVGVIAPWGLVADHGSAATRRTLFARAAVDRVTVHENRTGIFPIHRSVRFVSVTASTGASTGGLALRPAADGRAPARPGAARDDLWVDLALLGRADAQGLAVPCVRTPEHLQALETMLARGTRLSDAPWRLSFGRELNASDDRALLADAPAGAGTVPVVGGRDVQPFRVDVHTAAVSIREEDAARRLAAGHWRRWRLGYRDVASATNRLSLIAALVPPRVLTTHTVFVLREPLDLRVQWYLCGVFNSLVANWFVRLYMGSHVTAALLARLPVPVPTASPTIVRRVARLAARLGRHGAHGPIDSTDDYVTLQALVAGLYGLSAPQFAALTDTFPALPAEARARMVRALADGIDDERADGSAGDAATSTSAEGHPDGHGEHRQHPK